MMCSTDVTNSLKNLIYKVERVALAQGVQEGRRHSVGFMFWCCAYVCFKALYVLSDFAHFNLVNAILIVITC